MVVGNFIVNLVNPFGVEGDFELVTDLDDLISAFVRVFGLSAPFSTVAAI